MPILVDLQVELIEQKLPADADDALAEEAKRPGLPIMVSGAISASLGVASALPVAQ